jgi:hypothetical protein
MRFKTLAGMKVAVLEKQDAHIAFNDVEEAASLLHQFKMDAEQMAPINQLMGSAASPPASPQTSEENVRSLASSVVWGRLGVLRTPWGGRIGTPTLDQDDLTETQGGSNRPQKSAWIEINLRDYKGRPIPGERYEIKLPDGSLQTGILDAYGHAEYYGINPGTCEVSFPDIPDDKWDLA